VNPRDISVLATFRRRPDGSVIYAAGSIVDPAIPVRAASPSADAKGYALTAQGTSIAVV